MKVPPGPSPVTTSRILPRGISQATGAEDDRHSSLRAAAWYPDMEHLSDGRLMDGLNSAFSAGTSGTRQARMPEV